MKDYRLDFETTNVVCYDEVNLTHASDNEIIKLISDDKNISAVEMLCRIWEFGSNEKLVYKVIVNNIPNNNSINKVDVIKKCIIYGNKNQITYSRAIDILKLKKVITLDINNNIHINTDYNIKKYLKDRESIKYITIKM